ncbi:hypothetical protein EZV62_017727 [Acer yangbiense]|uniref:WHY domain class transcription factor n=1 Tax=Acer yangbiense TaxID=1000413 RepID=A0A5C7HHP9_9ROSI|nr:hypothetical protein EZV62_017727 [Acer yangbiense]
MSQLQILSSQTINPRLYPSHPLSTTKGNGSSSISLTQNIFTKKKKLSVKCRHPEYNEQQSYGAAPNNSSFAQQSPTPISGKLFWFCCCCCCCFLLLRCFDKEIDFGALPPRVYVGHSIYKGKAALQVEPRAPEFVSLDSGAFKLSREGFVLLQFAPAVGVRQYDWSRKQVFSLSVTEIGTLVGLGARESCEFFHDPFKGKSPKKFGMPYKSGHTIFKLVDALGLAKWLLSCELEEGKVRKVLKVEPLPDGSGHFFNLSVQNKLINLDESIYIPITKAEYTVLVSAFNFILPYILGWHAYANSIRADDPSRSNNANPRYGGDYEWNR